jgi:hypothetical protein
MTHFVFLKLKRQADGLSFLLTGLEYAGKMTSCDKFMFFQKKAGIQEERRLAGRSRSGEDCRSSEVEQHREISRKRRLKG